MSPLLKAIPLGTIRKDVRKYGENIHSPRSKFISIRTSAFKVSRKVDTLGITLTRVWNSQAFIIITALVRFYIEDISKIQITHNQNCDIYIIINC